jgi:hypothetical protein
MRTEAGFPWKFDTAAGAVGVYIVVDKRHPGLGFHFADSDKGTEVAIVGQAGIVVAYKE